MTDRRMDPRFVLLRILVRLIWKCPFKDKIGIIFRLSEKILPEPRGITLIRTIRGFDITVDPEGRRGFIDRDIYRLGGYEQGVTDFISTHCKSKSIIIDAGANIGAVALHAASVAKDGKVLAFEPLHEIYEDLRLNREVNNFQNLEIFEYALGSSSSKQLIYPDVTERGSSSFLKDNREGHKIAAPIAVRVRPLDDFTKNLHRVDLIKIDVEGYEVEVLRGASKTIKKFQPVIILEYDPTGSLTPKLNQHLEQLPYSMFTLRLGKHYPSSLVPLGTLSDLPKSKLATIILMPRN